jgi:hypothetical protein
VTLPLRTVSWQCAVSLSIQCFLRYFITGFSREQAISIKNLAGHAPAERLDRIGAAQAAAARDR